MAIIAIASHDNDDDDFTIAGKKGVERELHVVVVRKNYSRMQTS